ncbi:MAG TPA: hypothetical protein DIU39_05090 [Flavobacteriales bacterium]|nr:hypothetical protein [Flavobacteriales bacterium]|tara:strand:+ start:10229 stop:11029 length:801 start_codon:yes stop_codon:yes gene_type:complete
MNSKIFYIIVLTLFSFVAKAQNDTINQLDAQGRKQGKWVKYHENGQPRYVGQFKDNKPVGEFFYYDEEGNLTTYMVFDGNVARATMYFPDGKIMAKGKYVNQQKDSLWLYYDAYDSFVVSDEFYENGKKQGTEHFYYPDGKLLETRVYENGVENGPWIQYYDNGKKKMEATFENGSLNGKVTHYYYSGKPEIIGYYHKDLRHGVWTYYSEDGKVDRQVTYQNGECVKGCQENIEKPVEEKDKIYKDQLEPEDFMPGGILYNPKSKP